MIMLLPLLKESPVSSSTPSSVVLADSPQRWLATKHRDAEALKNLAWIRKLPQDDPRVQFEFAEITAAIREEEAATEGVSIKEVMAKGNPIRFLIACVLRNQVLKHLLRARLSSSLC
jgi:hypothetical protein